MARARNIKPSFFTNEKLAELPFSTRLLFVGLWTMCDRLGRMEDRPKRIKMNLFPADRVNVEAGLAQLDDAGFINRYVVDGEGFIEIPNFLKHQNPHVREAESTIPAPDKHSARHSQDRLIPESLQSDSPSTSAREKEQTIDAQDAKKFGYPLQDLFRAFPELAIAPGQMGMIVSTVKDAAIDRQAWKETIDLYRANHDPTGRSYNPAKIGTVLDVFKDKRTKLEKQQNGTSNQNGRRDHPARPTPAETIASRSYRNPEPDPAREAKGNG